MGLVELWRDGWLHETISYASDMAEDVLGSFVNQWMGMGFVVKLVGEVVNSVWENGEASPGRDIVDDVMDDWMSGPLIIHEGFVAARKFMFGMLKGVGEANDAGRTIPALSTFGQSGYSLKDLRK